MSTTIDILAPYRALLETLRNDRSAWDQVVLIESHDAENEPSDSNYIRRHGVLHALQYDLRPADEDLVRFLFRQQIRAREYDESHDQDESLLLPGYLLATFRRPEDVVLFWQAKTVDFDAFAGGFDWEFAAWVGGIEAAKSLQNASDSVSEDIFAKFQDDIEDMPEFDQEEIDRWWKFRQNYFSSTLKDESTRYLYCLASELENKEAAFQILDQWEAQLTLEPSAKELRSLAYRRREQGQFQHAYEVIKRYLSSINDLLFGASPEVSYGRMF